MNATNAVGKTGHNFYAFSYEGSKDWYSEHDPAR